MDSFNRCLSQRRLLAQRFAACLSPFVTFVLSADSWTDEENSILRPVRRLDSPRAKDTHTDLTCPPCCFVVNLHLEEQHLFQTVCAATVTPVCNETERFFLSEYGF